VFKSPFDASESRIPCACPSPPSVYKRVDIRSLPNSLPQGPLPPPHLPMFGYESWGSRLFSSGNRVFPSEIASPRFGTLSFSFFFFFWSFYFFFFLFIIFPSIFFFFLCCWNSPGRFSELGLRTFESFFFSFDLPSPPGGTTRPAALSVPFFTLLLHLPFP